MEIDEHINEVHAEIWIISSRCLSVTILSLSMKLSSTLCFLMYCLLGYGVVKLIVRVIKEI